jgi:hypothetical protein
MKTQTVVILRMVIPRVTFRVDKKVQILLPS